MTYRTATIAALILSATAVIAVTGCNSPSASTAVPAVKGAAQLNSSTTTLAPAAEIPTAEEIQRRRESWVGSW